MKKIFSVVAVVVGLIFCLSYVFAASGIPNLVGTWTVTSEGGCMLIMGVKGHEKSHWGPEQKGLKATATILEQNGRVLKGEFVSERAGEKFIAVIGPDNKKVYSADENGIMDMNIISRDKMEVIYRQVTEKDAVVAYGVWKRVKR